MNLLSFLQLPYMRKFEDLDDPEVTIIRRKIIQKNVYLKNLYYEFYSIFKNSLSDFQKRKRKLIELGSGGGFLKKIIPDVITSDIIRLPKVDMHFSATHMPFKSESVDRFFMLDVIHHINDQQMFLKEIDRCLKDNGKLIAIEPANTLWGRFIYQNFHHEDFNPKGTWNLKSQSALSDANGAIRWIVVMRDKKKFEKLFPRLKIVMITVHTPIQYLVSGGMSYRQLLPSWMYSIVKGVEYILSPLGRYTGMFYTIEIEKRRK